MRGASLLKSADRNAANRPWFQKPRADAKKEKKDLKTTEVSSGSRRVFAKRIAAGLLCALALQMLSPAALAVDSAPPTREEAISAFADACALPDADEAVLSRFDDAEQIGTTNRAAVACAVAAGVVKGTARDGRVLLLPKARITKLEALVLLARFLPDSEAQGKPVAGVPAWASSDLARLDAAGFDAVSADLPDTLGESLTKAQLTAYCEMLASARAAAGSLSHAGYTLEKVVVLSRHNIRSPLSGNGSLLGDITPHEWFAWSSKPSELSTRGGVLETQMGQYFRKWLEQEKLFPENYVPEDGAVRVYANSMQRTIATAQYFSSGLLPVANVKVEHHEQLNKMDPVFHPQLTFVSDSYRDAATAQINELYGQTVRDLADNYALLTDVIDMEDSEAFRSGKTGRLSTDDLELVFKENAEPGMTGSLKTACSVSDALVLQFYEESDLLRAGFGNALSLREWKAISEIKDVYGDVLFTAPLIAANVANPLLREIRSELDADGRRFTFLCGHDSNVGSVLAALNAEAYTAPGAIEAKTPIGCKLVFSLWRAADGTRACSVDLVYQTAWQLQKMPLLDLSARPAVYPITLEGIERNADGLYRASDVMERLDRSIAAYDDIRREYTLQPAA